MVDARAHAHPQAIEESQGIVPNVQGLEYMERTEPVYLWELGMDTVRVVQEIKAEVALRRLACGGPELP